MTTGTILAIVILGLVSVGVVLLYGTIAKNRWGINLDRIFCPRCNTPFPPHVRPENTRQTLWGGATCAKCGAEVDKWGREVNGQRRGHLLDGDRPEGQVRRVVGRRFFALAAAVFFGLTLLLDLLGTGPHPSTPSQWVALSGVAVVETAVFTVLFYVLVSLFIRLLRGRRRPTATQEQGRG